MLENLGKPGYLCLGSFPSYVNLEKFSHLHISCLLTFKRVEQYLYNLLLSLKKCSLLFVEPQLFLEKQIALTLFVTPLKNQLELL